jgi:endogenous inhibitor of DNA gyrase (YacG/DUF329 family)
VEVVCDSCGEAFEKRPAAVRETNFCDHGCFGEWLEENGRGENNPHWKGGDIERTCAVCGDAFLVERNVVHGNASATGEFCSMACYGEWLSENRSGPDSPIWEGGVFDYGTNWREVRQEALERDGFECVACGMDANEHRREYGTGLEVHHIQPLVTFDEPEDANTLGNVVSLCRDCHTEWEGIPLRPDTAAD